MFGFMYVANHFTRTFVQCSIIAGVVISFALCEYTVSESSGIIQVSVLRSRRTQEQSVVMVQSKALESSATGLAASQSRLLCNDVLKQYHTCIIIGMAMG